MTKRKLFARWWYVRSDQGLYGKEGLETIGYDVERGGDVFFMRGGPLPKRWFIENAAPLMERVDVKAAIAHFKRFRSDTNVRAVCVTVWRKVKR
jgi:hypothetical protein